MSKKALKIALITVTTLVILAEAFYLLAVPEIINKALQNKTVEKLVKESTGLNLSMDSIRVKTRLSFNADIDAENLKITDEANSEVLSAKKVYSRVSLFSLLFNSPNIRHFRAEELNLNITRNIDDNFYLGTYMLELDKEQNLKLKDFKGKFVDSKINFIDKKLAQNIVVDIPVFEIKEYRKGRYLNLDTQINIVTKNKTSKCELALDSRLPLNKNLDRAQISGKLENLDLSVYSSYVASNAGFSGKTQLNKISGLINANIKTNDMQGNKNSIILDATLENFALHMKNPADSFYSNGTINIISEGTASPYQIELLKTQIGTEKWKIITSGFIKNYKSKNPRLDLNVEIPKSELYPLYHLLPSLPDSNDAIQKLKKYGAWAFVEANLQVKGSVESPEIYGPMALSDLYILQEDKRIPKCKAEMDFIGKKFKLYTKIFIRPGQYVEVKGTSENKIGGYGEFEVSSSPEVDVEAAHTILLPIHDVVGFDLGPLPYMTLKGIGNINIKVKGTPKDGFIDGYFNFKNTTAILKDLDTTIENATGRMDFKGKDMYLVIDAKIKNSPIKISGDSNLAGKVDYKISADAVNTDDLLNIVEGSPALKKWSKLLEPLEEISGASQLDIKIDGLVKDYSNFIEVLNISGKLKLKDNTAKLKDFAPMISKINGTVEFLKDDWKANLNSEVFSSKVNITAKSEKNRLNADIVSENMKVDEILGSGIVSKLEQIESLNKSEKGDRGKRGNIPYTHAFLSLKANYSGTADKIDFNKLKLTGQFKPTIGNTRVPDRIPFLIRSGEIDLNNSVLSVKNFNSKLFNTEAKVNAKISNVFAKDPAKDVIYNYDLNIQNFDISSFDRMKQMRILHPAIRKILNTYENYSGRADVDITCKNNKENGTIKLQDIKFTQKALAIPIAVSSGDIILKDGSLMLKSVSAMFDGTPVFLNASVKDYKTDAKFRGYFTSKLTETFANKYINNNLTYPIKPKGDITITSEFWGDSHGYSIKPQLKFGEDADIYYMGANLGDTSDARELNGIISIRGNLIDVKKFSYIRYMVSQNENTYPLEIISANGKITRTANSYILDSFKVNTLNSANVKIFNVFFKKSVLKQGMFNCNLTLDGDVNTPRILGDASMTNLDMPMYDTVLNKIDVKFSPKLINLTMSGQSYNSDFLIEAVAKNKITLPVTIEEVKISSKKVNLDSIINSLTQVKLHNVGINPSAGRIIDPKTPLNVSDFIINKGEMMAQDVLIRDLPAKNYRAKFTLGEDSILNISDIGAEITGGTIAGLAGYNFKTAKLNLEMSAKNVDANKMASAFFDVKDQIFGSLDGEAVISTSGTNEEERLKNSSGSVNFVIKDGKMPKLGSIEYLLKAGNFFKSGITGLSINNLLDLLTPVKTGYFESIKGRITIADGVAQKLEIFSKGDNLSLFIRGKYDFSEQLADLYVFGRLTKKADGILGPVGNASFNSLLNLIPGIKLDGSDKSKVAKDISRIPGIELDDKVYRIFSAKIDGDIGGEKYVSSFKWIE